MLAGRRSKAVTTGSHPDGAEEWVQASIKVPDLIKATAERDIVEAVLRRPGVKSVNHHGDCLHVVYNPLEVTERELEEAIRQSGHTPAGGDAERVLPLPQASSCRAV